MAYEILNYLNNNFKFIHNIDQGLILLIIRFTICACVLGFISVYDMFLTWLERKVSAFMQDRLGPMYVGKIHGWAQPIVDGVKLFLKEDIIPEQADKKLFILSPYIVFMGTMAAFAVIPFSDKIFAADLNIGLFYILAVSSLIPLGIIIGGWASNNKWSTISTFRAAAQMVSYEIPIGITLLIPVYLTGSLSLVKISQAQSSGVLSWFIFKNPFLFLAFFIYFMAALAEVNRAPFDLPEAESELVAGFHTEYSGLRFALFFMAEYANMFVVASIATVCFLGGYNGLTSNTSGILKPFYILLKSTILIFIMIWLRWTLPRFRVDQLMKFCWQVLLPLAFLCFIGVMVINLF